MSEYFAGLEALPLILQRNYTLMRDLDKSLQVLLQQNGQRCEQEIEDIRRGVMSDNVAPDASLMRFSDEALDEQKHCIRIADEKVALAIRAYDAVDEQIQQLDKYLKKFDEQSRKEKDVITAVEMKAFSGEGNIKSTRVAEIKKGGRRKIQATVPVEQPSIDLELPVDPNEPTYCICNQVSYGEMVACDNPNCKIEWFHYGCVGLKEQPRGKWYCPNCVGLPKRRKGK